ncbi:MAG TPA: 50S ribosomal protein L13 [Nitrospiria bacterium]|nr:50S ribosomal protein L13 [Nitrospiria bacterium]
MKTVSAKKKDFNRAWYLVDAQNKILGRLASEVASILRGKHKPTFTPHVDCGDHVVIVNAAGIQLTGDKLVSKVYAHHSDYPGGFKSTTAGKLLNERPDRLVRWAIQGMLPKTKLGRAMIKKLRVYAGPEHPHKAQSLQALEVAGTRRNG